jgi:hypothetical protein
MAQLCFSPVAIAVTPEEIIVAGASLCVVLLSPNCPFQLAPQHLSAPETMAHV